MPEHDPLDRNGEPSEDNEACLGYVFLVLTCLAVVGAILVLVTTYSG